MDKALSSDFFLHKAVSLFLNKANCPFSEAPFPYFSCKEPFPLIAFFKALLLIHNLLAPLSNFFLQCVFYLMHFFLPSAFV